MAALACASVPLAGCAADAPQPVSQASTPMVSEQVASTDDSPAAASAATAAASPDASAVESAARDAVDASSARVSVSYVDLTTGAAFSIDGSSQRKSASVIKLAILAELLRQVSLGQHSLDDTLAVRSSDLVGGSGVISSAGSYSLRTLATDMIEQSDNVAANKIIDLVGMDAVNEEASALGLTATRLGRRMMDTAAQASGAENYMSSDDAATILRLIWSGQLVDQSSSAFARELLEGQAISVGVLQGVPSGITVAHKTGNLADVENDAAIVEAEWPYVLVVMASGGGDGEDLAAIANVSKAVWSAR